MYNNDYSKFLRLINEIGIEDAIKMVNVEDFPDGPIKIILRTIDYSVARLKEELS
jgi:hypothetical protein